MRIRRGRRSAPALALLAALVGCGGDDGSTGPDPDPEPDGEARSYLVGWAPGAPRPDESLIVALIDSIAAVSDVTIVQQPVPWPELLAGTPMADLVENRGALTDYLRSRGLEIVFLVDPLDGLDRRREDPALVAAGRSILEPEIRAMHEAWVLAIADRVRPRWLGLASEINTLAARGDPELYTGLRELVNDLGPRVRQASPGTKVFVSFQVDEAHGAFGDPVIDHFALIEDFDLDALGLSSYPVFAFDHPSDVPDDWFAAFDAATDLPLLMVEGGWSSEDVPLADGSPEEQVAFLRRYEELLEGVEAEAWVMLTFTDLDIDALGLPPERAAGLSNFARMGVLDVELRRKPAYAEWERIYRRPLRR